MMKMKQWHSGKLIILVLWILFASPLVLPSQSTEAQKHLDKASAFYKNSQYNEAIKEYNAAINLEPENLSAWENLGWAYWRSGEPDQAFKIWDNLLKLQPNNTLAINKVATMYGNVYEYDKAVELFKKSILLDPKQKEAYLGMAKLYQRKADFANALSNIAELKKRYPDDEGILILEGMVLDNLKKYSDAIKIWESLVKLNPKELRYRLNIALDRMKLGDAQEAVKICQDIIKEKPDYLEAYKLLAEEAVAREDFKQAKNILNKANAYKSGDTDILNRLSEAAQQDKDYDMVIKAANLSIESKPAQYSAYIDRADAYLEKGEYTNALKGCEFILSNNPHDIWALTVEFWAYLNKEDFSNALKTLESLLPGDPRNHLLLATLKRESGYYKEAINVINDFRERIKKGTVTSILYHGISENPHDRENIFSGEFREHMRLLKKQGYNAITLSDILDNYQRGKPLPDKPLLITFDDGKRDSFIYADPILKEFGFKAVMFVPIMYTKDNSDIFLSFSELKTMLNSGRWDIQAHGLSAHDIVIIDKDGAKADFLANKKWFYNGSRFESDEEFYKRIKEDYQECKRILEKRVPGARIIGYAFPRNNFGQIGFTNYPASMDLNLNLVKECYKFGFYQSNYGQTILSKDNMLIQRYEVTPGTKAQQLADYLRDNDLDYLSTQQLVAAYTGLYKFREVDTLLEGFPDKEKNCRYYTLKGQSLWAQNKLQAAEQAFEKAVFLDKGNAGLNKSLDKIQQALKPSLKPQYYYFKDNKNRTKNKYTANYSQYLEEAMNLRVAYEKAYFHDEGFARVEEDQGLAQLSYYPGAYRVISLTGKIRSFSNDTDMVAYRTFAETPLSKKTFAAASFEKDSIDTARGILAGIEYYRSRVYIKSQPTKPLSATLQYSHDEYNDKNTRDDASILLMRRFRKEKPEFFAGGAYRWGDSKFNASEYYTPRSLSSIEAHFKMISEIKKLGFIQYCVLGYGTDASESGLTYSSTSTFSYKIKPEWELFTEIEFSGTPSYRSRELTAGFEYKF